MKENVQSGAAEVEYFIGAGRNLTEYLPVTLFLGIFTVADVEVEVEVEDGEIEGRAEEGAIVGDLDVDGFVETIGENEENIDGESDGGEDCDIAGFNIVNGVPSNKYSCPMLLEGSDERRIFTDMKGPWKLKWRLIVQIEVRKIYDHNEVKMIINEINQQQ